MYPIEYRKAQNFADKNFRDNNIGSKITDFTENRLPQPV
jgi:hypothetical protein